MKKFIYIVFFLFAIQTSFAQDEQPGEGGQGRLRDKMVEYVQTKLALDKAESDKFQPVFLDYIKELRKTNQEFRGDRLVLQQKVVELRLRYREQFKPMIGEKRSNDVFKYEREFIEKAADVLKERRQERRGNQGKISKLFSN